MTLESEEICFQSNEPRSYVSLCEFKLHFLLFAPTIEKRHVFKVDLARKMWQEIERISGVPFPNGSHRQGSSSVDTNLGGHISHEGDVARLRRDLLIATNHATAAEIKLGSERERNRVIEEENALLREDLRDLNDNLQTRMYELDEKGLELDRASKVIQSLQIDLKEVEDKLSRVSNLELDLSNHKVEEEHLRSELCKAMEEVDKIRSRNAVQEEKILHLQENLRETTEASKQRENTATTIANETKHSLQILEAKLVYSNEQLSRAEERERRSSICAEKERQEVLSIHQNMQSVIEGVRQEMHVLHTAELEKMNIALESAKQQITNVTEKLHEQQLQSLRETDRLTKSNTEMQKRIEEATDELEDQIARCRSLQTELEKVRKQRVHVPLNYARLI